MYHFVQKNIALFLKLPVEIVGYLLLDIIFTLFFLNLIFVFFNY